MNIVVIGNGMIGSNIAKQMRERNIDDIYTVDIDPKTKPDYTNMLDFYNDKGVADVYIIAVWTQDQVLKITGSIVYRNHPLISLETACDIGTYHEMKKIVKNNADLVVFHERFVDRDPSHNIFNQPRVMGGDYISGRRFYLRYMLWENIIVTNDPELAEICKVAENAYRYVEIATAQELKMMVDERFDELRRLMNTKWNINMLEARDGIGGHCLGKDINIINKRWNKNDIFKAAEKSNKKYVSH